MYRQAPRHTRWLCLLLAASLLSAGLLPAAATAQDRRRKPVVVSFGQPNIWSLEQAHYLLARMHMANLDLQAKTLSADDLDPNLTHGTRIQILRQLLEIGAAFDQNVGFQNERLVETARFNDDRRRNLTANRDRLRANSMQLSLDINQLKRERAAVADAESAQAKQLDAAIKQKEDDRTAVNNEITFHDGEIQRLGAEPSGTPTAAALPTPLSSPRVPAGILDDLTKEELKELAKPGNDPKLNATTMLDNTVQLQYEIIAKQLTLLRDEVGPGERLVFLELPQSIYTTPGPGDEKMAQAWWHVNGYTRTDKLVRLLLDLYEVERKWYDIRRVPAFRALDSHFTPCPEDLAPAQSIPKAGDVDASLKDTFEKFRKEHVAARRRAIDKLFREANLGFDRVEQNGARDTSELVEAVRKMLGIKPAARPARADDDDDDDDGGGTGRFVDLKDAARATGGGAAAKTREDLDRERVETLKWNLLDLLSKERPDVCNKERFSFEKGIEFVRLDEENGRGPAARDIERRTVRTVDIIPRQSSLNVNDIQDTVKATGILAAFKFLFGFAGQVNFQRQREQFEQFVHQELYASGFGKGNRDFGWTFGALPGTKRVAPGVRTTYAALVVPNDAESLILSARGCYFPRKSYQPLDFEDTAHGDWADDDRFRRYNCGDEQTYILPIPGGGDTSSFWVTHVDFMGGQKAGEYVTVSVRGNNFSSQMGVLVDGVPLLPTVGLAHPHLMPRRAAANGAAAQPLVADCASVTDGICGRYERIDPRQIVFSFKMKNAYEGTPTITLIGPGKSVDLNMLGNLRIFDGQNDHSNIPLSASGVARMFGSPPPPPPLSITELQVLSVSPDSPAVVALVSGVGFTPNDSVFVNGMELLPPAKTFRSSRLYRLTFNPPAGEELKITVAQDRASFTKTVPNPAALKITAASVLSYEPPARRRPGVMIVRLEGTGFNSLLQPGQGAAQWQLVSVSPREMVVRFINPGPSVAVTLADSITGGSASVAVQRPAAAKKEDTKKQDAKKQDAKKQEGKD